VKRGQTIALDPDDGLVAVDDDPTEAVLGAIKTLTRGYELLGDSEAASKRRPSPARRGRLTDSAASALVLAHTRRAARLSGAARRRKWINVR